LNCRPHHGSESDQFMDIKKKTVVWFACLAQPKAKWYGQDQQDSGKG